MAVDWKRRRIESFSYSLSVVVYPIRQPADQQQNRPSPLNVVVNLAFFVFFGLITFAICTFG
jgi:hypothetical protein